MEQKQIVIRGAKEHNLKNVDLTLPRNQFIVFTGLSGSGKSSLAFDTIYAEGQRRYVESLSAYARQFLGQMDKPDVDSIEGLSPAISIDQKTTSKNPRSTVGTVTEIYDYLRLLYARIGRPHCPKCGNLISSQTVEQIVDHVMTLPEGTRIQILAPLVRGRKGEHHKLLADIRQQGYVRMRIDGDVRGLEEKIMLEKNKKHTLEVVVDRLIIRPGLETRLADSLETALNLAEGLVVVQLPEGEDQLYSQRFACPDCGFSIEELTPRLFSFNSPFGACPECSGLGVKLEFDPALVVPNSDLSLEEGALAPLAGGSYRYIRTFVNAVIDYWGASLTTPFKDLPSKLQDLLLYGSGKEKINFKYRTIHGRIRNMNRIFPGILKLLEERYKNIEDEQSREELDRFMSKNACPSCKGLRLRPEALAVTIGDENIAAVAAKSIRSAEHYFAELKLNEKDMIIARLVLKEIQARLRFLNNVGLGYLTLDRAAGTLSGGESQRIRLATQIGSGLTGVLYILDEPSIGLHQRDNSRLLQTLKELRDLGNTVIVVEHDEETIRAADYIVDIGPGAGKAGGEIVAAGRIDQIAAEPRSITGAYLTGKQKIPVPSVRRSPNGKWLRVKGAKEHNLKDIDIDFPLGVFICVTGVSGSGKSSLVNDILSVRLSKDLHRSRRRPGEHEDILGIEYLDKVITIDQSPIGRTPRSNPATYTKLFDSIRELFSLTRDAKMRGYKPGRFSFNVKGGRCEACRGDGILKIAMHFLPDVYVPCEVCHGKRYNRETLEVCYKGKSISDVLEMPVSEALEFFNAIPKIRRKLETLYDVGLGYVQLGQSATTLSGGEAQRVKLAAELSRRSNGKTLYILDEPTTGLHIDDISKLLHILDRLVENGDTVMVIEHNLEVIAHADYLIDLGPEGGDKGGLLVASGTPEQVAEKEGSYTGYYLKGKLGDASRV